MPKQPATSAKKPAASKKPAAKPKAAKPKTAKRNAAPQPLFSAGVLPVERYYPTPAHMILQYVVITGEFDGFSPETIKMRLQQRNLFVAPSAGAKVLPSLVGAFAGKGARPAVLAQLNKAGISVCGPSELVSLLKTPLVGLREHVEDQLQELNLHAWRLGPPANPAAIALAEEALGCSLPGALRALYEQCDGVAIFADYSSKKAPRPTQANEADLWSVAHRRASPRRVWIPSLDVLVRQRVDPSPSYPVGRKTFAPGTLRAHRIDLWDPYYPAILMPAAGDGVWIGDDHGVAFPWGPIPFEDYFWTALSRGLSSREWKKLRIGELR